MGGVIVTANPVPIWHDPQLSSEQRRQMKTDLLQAQADGVAEAFLVQRGIFMSVDAVFAVLDGKPGPGVYVVGTTPTGEVASYFQFTDGHQ